MFFLYWDLCIIYCEFLYQGWCFVMVFLFFCFISTALFAFSLRLSLVFSSYFLIFTVFFFFFSSFCAIFTFLLFSLLCSCFCFVCRNYRSQFRGFILCFLLSPFLMLFFLSSFCAVLALASLYFALVSVCLPK